MNYSSTKADSDEEADKIDWSIALETVLGDRELLKEIVGAFLIECPRLLETIRISLDNDDVESRKIAAHTLKGSLRYFGVSHSYDLAFKLEQGGQEIRLSESREIFGELSKQLEHILPKLQGYFDSDELS